MMIIDGGSRRWGCRSTTEKLDVERGNWRRYWTFVRHWFLPAQLQSCGGREVRGSHLLVVVHQLWEKSWQQSPGHSVEVWTRGERDNDDGGVSGSGLMQEQMRVRVVRERERK